MRATIIMQDKRPNLSRGKKNKSMLEKLLEKWDLSYVGFSEYLGINRKTLMQYRKGQREFRLNMEQIKKLQQLLKKVNLDFDDLSPDWYKDIDGEEN